MNIFYFNEIKLQINYKMLFKKLFSHLSSIRLFSTTSRLYTKEFVDRHLQNLLNDHEFTSMSSALLHIRSSGHRVYIIQPSMKFKARGRQSTTAQLQLAESISLIETINKWRIVGHGIYTLKSSGSKRYLYGTGNIEKITNEIRQCHATAVFVSIDRLSLAQIDGLTEKFRVPVYDRYSIVLQVDFIFEKKNLFEEFMLNRYLKIMRKVVQLNCKLL
jgi:hypothetical protein